MHEVVQPSGSNVSYFKIENFVAAACDLEKPRLEAQNTHGINAIAYIYV